jgi:hypothetical protein
MRGLDQLREAEALETEADMLAMSGAFRQASDAMRRCNKLRAEALGVFADPNELRDRARERLARQNP